MVVLIFGWETRDITEHIWLCAFGTSPKSSTDAASKSSVFGRLPERFTVFHWHGDTFDLPPGATMIAESDACRNQAFEYGGRVIGLQFHLDTTLESIRRLVAHCGDELVPGECVQSERELLVGHRERLADLCRYSEILLDGDRGRIWGLSKGLLALLRRNYSGT